MRADLAGALGHVLGGSGRTGYIEITPPGNTLTSNVSNGASEMNGFGYDAGGKMPSVNGSKAGYDAENRHSWTYDPVTQGTQSYAYDGDGRRRHQGLNCHNAASGNTEIQSEMQRLCA